MVQEITTTSWGRRIINALWGILIGFILVIGAFVLVFWNEGHGLHITQSLEEAGKVLVTIPASPVDPKNNGHAVYLTGKASTQQELQDKLFAVNTNAIRLIRKAEMYQWQQNTETTTQKQMGGGEQQVKTYTYKKIWSSSLIDSSHFKDPTGHTNPESMPISGKTEQASSVTIGDFTLSSDLVDQMTGETPIDLSKSDLSTLKERLNKPVKLNDNVVYAGETSDAPAIGDMRFTLTEVLPQEVSIIAQQSDNTFTPYMAKAGKTVSLLAMGHESPQEMIINAEHENEIQTIILRFVSLVLMIIGFGLLMQPIVVLADFIPMLGSLISFGTGTIAFVAGLVLWTIATAIAWFAFRPLWAVGLIIIVAGTCYLILSSKRRLSQNKVSS